MSRCDFASKNLARAEFSSFMEIERWYLLTTMYTDERIHVPSARTHIPQGKANTRFNSRRRTLVHREEIPVGTIQVP